MPKPQDGSLEEKKGGGEKIRRNDVLRGAVGTRFEPDMPSNSSPTQSIEAEIQIKIEWYPF